MEVPHSALSLKKKAKSLVIVPIKSLKVEVEDVCVRSNREPCQVEQDVVHGNGTANLVTRKRSREEMKKKKPGRDQGKSNNTARVAG